MKEQTIHSGTKDVSGDDVKKKMSSKLLRLSSIDTTNICCINPCNTSTKICKGRKINARGHGVESLRSPCYRVDFTMMCLVFQTWALVKPVKSRKLVEAEARDKLIYAVNPKQVHLLITAWCFFFRMFLNIHVLMPYC